MNYNVGKTVTLENVKIKFENVCNESRIKSLLVYWKHFKKYIYRQ